MPYASHRLSVCLIIVSSIVTSCTIASSEAQCQSSKSFEACIESSHPHGICELASFQVVDLWKALEVGSDGVTIRCGTKSRILEHSKDSTALSIQKDDVKVSGCTFDRAILSLGKGAVININGARRVTLDNVTIQNANATGIHIANSSHVMIEDSNLSNEAGDAIYIEGDSTGIQILSNRIDTAISGKWHHGIGAHSSKAGKRVSHILIQNNHILNGASFCVEIGAFGGEPPTDVTIDRNVCEQIKAVHSSGGYSLDTVYGAVLTKNIYVNHTGTHGILPGIELVGGHNANVDDNTIYDASISVNKQSYTDVVRNSITVASSLGRSTTAIYIGSSVRNTDNSHVNIHDNHVVYLPCIGLHVGIFLQCNAEGVNCSHIYIADNKLQGNGERGGVAIKVENDSPIADRPVRIVITDNRLNGWSICYAKGNNGIKATNLRNRESCATLLAVP